MLESVRWRLKVPSEVGKFLLKLESQAEIRKFGYSWKVLTEVAKLKFSSNFSTSTVTFQIRHELSNFIFSNFISYFPTCRSIQLPFPTTCIAILHILIQLHVQYQQKNFIIRLTLCQYFWIYISKLFNKICYCCQLIKYENVYGNKSQQI